MGFLFLWATVELLQQKLLEGLLRFVSELNLLWFLKNRTGWEFYRCPWEVWFPLFFNWNIRGLKWSSIRVFQFHQSYLDFRLLLFDWLGLLFLNEFRHMEVHFCFRFLNRIVFDPDSFVELAWMRTALHLPSIINMKILWRLWGLALLSHDNSLKVKGTIIAWWLLPFHYQVILQNHVFILEIVLSNSKSLCWFPFAWVRFSEFDQTLLPRAKFGSWPNNSYQLAWWQLLFVEIKVNELSRAAILLGLWRWQTILSFEREHFFQN